MVATVLNSFPINVDRKYVTDRPSSYKSFMNTSPISGVFNEQLWRDLGESGIQTEEIKYQDLLGISIGKWLIDASRGGGKLVDYNCGTAPFSEALHMLTGHSYIGFDRNKTLLDGAKARWYHKPWAQFELGEFEVPAPFVKNSISIVWTYGVLGNCSYEVDQDKTLQDIFTILKPGGNYVCFEETITTEYLREHNVNVAYSYDYSVGCVHTESRWRKKFYQYGFVVKEKYADMWWLIRRS